MSAGTIQTVSPSTLIVAANVRKDTKLTKEFVESIKQHGVMVPITAQETPEGLAVIDGQRRTLAAVDGGLATVPVYVVDPVKDEGVRIVDQLVINGEREAMTAIEIVTAVQDLELFGMSATVIAKKTGFDKKEVQTALAVAGSKVATSALESQQASFTDAAILVEFEDHPKIVADLLDSISRGHGLEHSAQRHRDQLREVAARAEVADQIATAGITMLDSSPSYDDTKHLRADQVFTTSKRDVEVPLEVLIAEAGPDLRAYVKKNWGGYNDGEKVPDTWEIGYAIANWGAHGWFTHSHLEGRGSAPKTEEEKAVDRLARENTKVWKSATEVRIAWLQGVFQSKFPPKGWETIVADFVVGPNAAAWGGVLAVLDVTHEGDNYSRRESVVKFLGAHPNKAWQVSLATAVGTIEGGFEFDRKGWQQGKTPAYLQLLAGWGYELSELEQSIVDAAKAASAA